MGGGPRNEPCDTPQSRRELLHMILDKESWSLVDNRSVQSAIQTDFLSSLNVLLWVY